MGEFGTSKCPGFALPSAFIRGHSCLFVVGFFFLKSKKVSQELRGRMECPSNLAMLITALGAGYRQSRVKLIGLA